MQVRYAVAGSESELTSESSGLSAVGTTAGSWVVGVEFENANRVEINTPENALDEYGNSGCPSTILDRLSRSAFFGEYLQRGKTFETYVKGQFTGEANANIKAILNTEASVITGFTLQSGDNRNYRVYEQVQFYLPGSTTEYFIADFIVVFILNDRAVKTIVFETKISNSTPLTSNQSFAKNDIPASFSIRSNKAYLKDLFNDIEFQQSLTGNALNLSSFYIIYSNGQGNQITGTK